MTEDLLRALRIPFTLLDDPRHVARRIAKAQTLAYSANKPVALLLVPRSDVGGLTVDAAQAASGEALQRQDMLRLDALNAVYRSRARVVVTIMGAVAAELQSIGHRPNFFYLQHAMGLASSMGLGIALAQPGSAGRRVRRRRIGADEPRRPDDAGALPAAQPGARRVRQREPALGRRLPDGDVHGQRSRRHRRGGRRAAHGDRPHARGVHARVRRARSPPAI